jgi:hypothetical protein
VSRKEPPTHSPQTCSRACLRGMPLVRGARSCKPRALPQSQYTKAAHALARCRAGPRAPTTSGWTPDSAGHGHGGKMPHSSDWALPTPSSRNPRECARGGASAWDRRRLKSTTFQQQQNTSRVPPTSDSRSSWMAPRDSPATSLPRGGAAPSRRGAPLETAPRG